MSQRTWMNADFMCPVFQAHRLTVVGEQSSVDCIALLLLACAPLAVIRRVSCIVVKSFNRVCWTWLWSHISQEMKKRLSPSLADRNLPASVSMVARCVGVIASCLHHFPGIVLGCFRTGMSASFRSIAKVNRIISTHLKLLQSFMVDRSASRFAPPGCSHYCDTYEMVVQ